MRFLVVITCADIYNEYPTLGCERCARGGGVLPYMGYIGMCRGEG